MPIIDSVAAVFCHAGQVFCVRRQPHLAAFPGYESFPGGKIDRNDSKGRHQTRHLRDFDGREMYALVREVAEELAYDLLKAISSGEVTSVRPLATALAPAFLPIRFRLHFYRIDLKTRPEFTPNPAEIQATLWATPEQLLARFNAGNSLMVPPLRWLLEKLVASPTGCEFGDISPYFDEDNFVPLLENLSELRTLPVPSNTLPPATRTNAFLLGEEGAPGILVDPAPASPEVLAKLLRTICRHRVDSLLITHHHLDHHQHAADIARHLSVPAMMSEDTHARILSQWGSGYFDGVAVEIKQAGDFLTTWKGEPVRVHHIPGHDSGQLGVAPESMRWFLVGDLIQNIGTVVIAAPEGDMAAYFKTLGKLIDAAPDVIVPSHGIPMRSVHRLQEALKHRRERERAIGELHNRGHSESEILAALYSDIDKRLHPLALENIRSHLVKLTQEEAF